MVGETEPTTVNAEHETDPEHCPEEVATFPMVVLPVVFV